MFEVLKQCELDFTFNGFINHDAGQVLSSASHVDANSISAPLIAGNADPAKILPSDKAATF
eukprot:8362073-Karenia_brevis.AAC.1